MVWQTDIYNDPAHYVITDLVSLIKQTPLIHWSHFPEKQLQMAAPVPTFTFNNGVKIPSVGIG